MPPRNMPLGPKDHFELIILRKYRHRKSYKKSKSYPFVKEIFICTKREHYQRQIFSPETDLHGRANFGSLCVSSSYLPLNCILPPKALPDPCSFPSLRIMYKPQLSGHLLSLISWWGSHLYVHN